MKLFWLTLILLSVFSIGAHTTSAACTGRTCGAWSECINGDQTRTCWTIDPANAAITCPPSAFLQHMACGTNVVCQEMDRRPCPDATTTAAGMTIQRCVDGRWSECQYPEADYRCRNDYDCRFFKDGRQCNEGLCVLPVECDSNTECGGSTPLCAHGNCTVSPPCNATWSCTPWSNVTHSDGGCSQERTCTPPSTCLIPPSPWPERTRPCEAACRNGTVEMCQMPCPAGMACVTVLSGKRLCINGRWTDCRLPPPPLSENWCRETQDCGIVQLTNKALCARRTSSLTNRSTGLQRRVEALEYVDTGDLGGGGDNYISDCVCRFGSCVWAPKPIPMLPPNLTNSCGGSDGYCVTDCSRTLCALVGSPGVSGPTPCTSLNHLKEVCACPQSTCQWVSLAKRAHTEIGKYPPVPANLRDWGIANAILHAPNDEVRARLLTNLQRFQDRYQTKYDELVTVEMPDQTTFINATKSVRFLIWHFPIVDEYHTNADGLVVALTHNIWGKLLPRDISTTPIQPVPMTEVTP